MKVKYVILTGCIVFISWIKPALSAVTDVAYVYFSYNITAASCTVDIHNVSFNFYMNAVELEKAGSSSDWQSLPGQTIKLFNCFDGSNSVVATVSGVMDSEDSEGFKNQREGEGAATGVSVQLKSGDVALHNNDVLTTKVKSDHTLEIPLSARLYSIHGNATAGEIYSVINLTLTYK